MNVSSSSSLHVMSALLGQTFKTTFVTVIALIYRSSLVSRTDMDRQQFNYSLKIFQFQV